MGFTNTTVAGLKLWLDAGVGVTQSGGTVSSWADQSGNGNDFVQATGGSQPTFNATSINGKPGIAFSGSQGLSSSMLLGGAKTVLVVSKMSVTPSPTDIFYEILSVKNSSPAFSDLIVINDAGYQPYTFVDDFLSAGSTAGIANALDTSPHSTLVTYDGGTNTSVASYTATFDGVSQTVLASAASGRVGTDVTSLGSRITNGNAIAFGFQGEICEVLVWDHVLSAPDLAAAQAYINAKYFAALSIDPVSITIGPLQTVNPITASGGNDGGNPANYVFSVVQNQSGGSLTDHGDGTAEWDAGGVDGVDIIRVTDLDSNTADSTITVTTPPALSIAPTPVSLAPLATQLFTAVDGVGPYIFTILTNNSGGSLVDHGDGTATYTVGATPSVTDFIRVTDANADTADAEVDVGTYPSLSIAPSTVTVPPLGSQTFVGSGGTGGYSYAITDNQSGGTIDPTTGVYVAGSAPSCTDTIEVTDSSSSTADATVTIGAGVTLSPGSVTKAPGGTQTFTAAGGSGTGFVYSFSFNGSGGSINASTGAYIAGNVASNDQIIATDSLGNVSVDSMVTIPGVVVSPSSASLAPLQSTNFSAVGGSGTGFVWAFVINNSGGTINSSTGHYVAGPTGSVTDTIQATDSLGNTSSGTNITVSAALAISPPTATVAPRVGFTFTSSGGSGVGATFSFVHNNSGGTLNTSTGAYVAGATGSVTDTVRVVDNSGAHSDGVVTVGPNLSISPSNSTINKGSTRTFTHAGGSGSGIVFSLIQNQSGGTINSSTGLYTAGQGGGNPAVDIIRVVDDAANSASATVSAYPPNFYVSGITLIGLSTMRVRFSYPPKAVDPTATDDGLRPDNYVLVGNDVTYVIAAIPVLGDENSIDCLMAAPLGFGKWTLSVSNVKSADGGQTI